MIVKAYHLSTDVDVTPIDRAAVICSDLGRFFLDGFLFIRYALRSHLKRRILFNPRIPIALDCF